MNALVAMGPPMSELNRSLTLSAADRPLRVMLVTQASGGGVGRHFLDLAEGLSAAGAEVVGVYAPRKIDQQFRRRLASPALPTMIEMPMHRAIHPLDGVDVWKLAQLIRQHGPFDVVHGHSSKGGALARLAARWMNVPSVYTPNAFVTLDPSLSKLKRKMYGMIETWLAKRTASIIAVSYDEQRHAEEHLGIRSELMTVIPNGISPPAFPDRQATRNRLGLRDDEVVIGFIGRLAHQKAPDVMLDTMALLADVPNVKLVMVGSGPDEEAVKAQLARLQLQDRVLMLGDVVGLEHFPAFDLFCLSSRYEGMPYVLLEALAAGLPIVSTRVEGVTMTVEPEVNGLIVERDRPAELAAALRRVVTEAQLRSQFAAGSLARAKRFTLDAMVDSTMQLYRRVIAESAR
ncbi:glycosyl transferase group 1 [Pirellula staleyi DSM 6068]|uniref:Glycosyl transferase group 1 n=1 Tax=Pirellula staleyi (strain ATCC 27377 / DSM 6068 / ICPB 4128) TaxID=530564 RepID=D2QX18_PIRSD|nr:glycosyltransferase family 4 protein [Pirellula staleyi]ADB16122.1 glycosyl transferase group 1 [Pirellula staleyi DSM 6068]